MILGFEELKYSIIALYLHCYKYSNVRVYNQAESDVVEPPTHPRALIGQCYFNSEFCTITKTCQHGIEQRAFYIIIIIRLQFLFKISKCITASIVLFLLIKWHVK